MRLFEDLDIDSSRRCMSGQHNACSAGGHVESAGSISGSSISVPVDEVRSSRFSEIFTKLA